MKNMQDDILKVLLSEEEIAEKVQEIGAHKRGGNFLVHS